MRTTLSSYPHRFFLLSLKCPFCCARVCSSCSILSSGDSCVPDNGSLITSTTVGLGGTQVCSFCAGILCSRLPSLPLPYLLISSKAPHDRISKATTKPT